MTFFTPFSALKRLLIVAAAMLLAACHVDVFVTGEGSVGTMQTDIRRCNTAPDCFSVGAGQPITLVAAAAPGHRFAGWGGACARQSGSQCTLTVKGDTRVQATFVSTDESRVYPLMLPDSEYFFSAPWPNDAYSRRQDGHPDVSAFPSPNNSKVSGTLKRLASSADGFSTNGGVFMQLNIADSEWQALAPRLTHTQVASAQDYTGGYFINIDARSPRYGERIPANLTGFMPATDSHAMQVDHYLELTGLMLLAPVPGYVLEPSRTYAAVLLKQQNSITLQASPLLAALRAPDGTATGLSASVVASLRQQLASIDTLMTQQAYGSEDDLAAFTVFTTQNPKRVDAAIGRAIAAITDDDLLENITSISAPDICRMNTYCFSISTRMPDFLTGDAPYLFGGGSIQVVNDTAIVQRSPTLTLFVSIPYTTPPADGFPLIVSAAATGQTLREGGRGAINVSLSAPQSSERRTADVQNALAFLGKLGLDEYAQADLVNALVDFNIINLEAAQNQHLQYAAELHYTLRLARLMPHITARIADTYGVTLTGAFDPALVTLSGTSLGAIATLHTLAQGAQANVVTGYNAPRPSYLHVDNALKLLEDNMPAVLPWLLNYTKFDRHSLAQPMLQLMQTALEPMDIANYADELNDKSLMWLLGPYDETLHGGISAYSMATALVREQAIQPVALNPDYDFDPNVDFQTLWPSLGLPATTGLAGHWNLLSEPGRHLVAAEDYGQIGNVLACYPLGLALGAEAWPDLYLYSAILSQCMENPYD